jgi:hypothetical protein
MRVWILAIALVACKREPADKVKWGEPVGIELAGEDLIAAVAAESGHDIDNAAVPGLATALASVTKACPDIRGVGTNSVSIQMSAKDGVLSAPADTGDPLGLCVAHALDGKAAPKLGTTRLLVQIAAKPKGKP